MKRDFVYWGSSLGEMRVPTEVELRAVSPFQMCRWDSEFLDSYLLVCPHCGEIWLRSECEGHSLPHRWSIRERYCFEHAAEHFAAVQPFVRRKLDNLQAPFLNAPGAILSFYSHFHAIGQEQWLLWLNQLPAAARRFEIRAWTALDLRINPHRKVILHGASHLLDADGLWADPDESFEPGPAIPSADTGTSIWDDGWSALSDWPRLTPESPRREDHQLRSDGDGQDPRPVNDPLAL